MLINLEEIYEEKNESEDQETLQVRSLREALTSVEGIRKYISSIEK